MFRDVYSGRLKLNGEEHEKTLLAASNYATSLLDVHRYAEGKSLLRKSIPLARRVIGESNEVTLRMRGCYAEALYRNDSATLDDLREAVTTLEGMERIARRVFGGTHPIVKTIGRHLQNAREALRARETPSPG